MTRVQGLKTIVAQNRSRSTQAGPTRIVRAADCRRMPWKNGGGETVEIATFPEGAGLDDFIWRLSAARVARDGPFSSFAGIDRTLAVLSGEGLDLTVGGRVTRLTQEDAPLSFPGDPSTEARLLGGAVEDFNVMTRRGAVRHRMRRVAVNGTLRCHAEAGLALLFCGEGRLTVEGVPLEPRDTLVLDDAEQRDLDLAGQGIAYVVEIERMPM